MNLFALTNTANARIVRFPLTQKLQEELKELFSAQLKAFTCDITDIIEFDGRYKPDEKELLIIKRFDGAHDLESAVANPMAIEQFDPNIHSLKTIKAIFTGDPNAEGRVLIQYFESRRLIATENIAIFFSGNTFQRMSYSGLALDNKLVAVLEGKELKFHSFHFLSRIFDLDRYYREATAAELKAFANHEKLVPEDPTTFESTAGSLVRRKIGHIIRSGILDKNSTEQIVDAAHTFNLQIKISDSGKIILPSNMTDLRQLLRFLEEDYYESTLSKTHYLSNSKRVTD